jgi:acyl-CoA thioesterase I
MMDSLMNELLLVGRRHFTLLALGLAVAGNAAAGNAAAGNAAAGNAPTQKKTQQPAAKPKKILVVGDSLSAEYGLKRGEGWVALLEKRLADKKLAAQVINASISGDTTSGGKARLGALLAQHQPTHVVIELGGNDALRGLPLASTRRNLSDMVQATQKSGAKAMLISVQVPPNYGADYQKQFEQSFVEVAKAHKLPAVPFLLKGVADIADPTELFQADRIHPTAKAHPIMLSNVWPTLEKFIQ